LTRIFGADDLPHGVDFGKYGESKTLEAKFRSDELRHARRVRDAFLHEVLDGRLDEVTPTYSHDLAISINSTLKMLINKKPDDYKSIFLNWMFLSEVGAALHRNKTSVEHLGSDISREISLLQKYFKIHLLELDDRYRIREDMPGIFYCFQIPNHQDRENAVFSVA
jgi:hypothetical protein